MPRKASKKKKAKSKIPPWGRSEKHVQKDMGLRKFSTDVPLGNTDPTMVQGKLYGNGGVPNRASRGGLRQQRGKRS